MTQIQTMNPYGSAVAKDAAVQSASDQQRAIQEVQAALIIAKKFPRDTATSVDNIIKECLRPSLAESAEYAFPRGNQTVTGPSIRLAESIARCWGNIDYGMRELEQNDGESQVEAYAWDMETNTRARRVFTVKHVRHTRQGQYKLTDPRDVYELAANQGARRMRACILELIPGDVVDTALKQVELTLRSNVDVTPEALEKMLEAFAAFGVTEDHIAKRFGKKLSALLPAEFVNLKQIYAGLRDGMSKPSDWFDLGQPDQTVQQEEIAESDAAIEEVPEPKAKPAEKKKAGKTQSVDSLIKKIAKAKDRDAIDAVLADSEGYELSDADRDRIVAAHADRVNELNSED